MLFAFSCEAGRPSLSALNLHGSVEPDELEHPYDKTLVAGINPLGNSKVPVEIEVWEAIFAHDKSSGGLNGYNPVRQDVVLRFENSAGQRTVIGPLTGDLANNPQDEYWREFVRQLTLTLTTALLRATVRWRSSQGWNLC